MGLELLACSGPGAMAEIAGNIAFGRILGLIAGVLAFTSFRLWCAERRRHPLPILCAVLFIFHPAWTMSATKGDCGYGLVDSAIFHNAVAAGIVCFQFRGFLKMKRPEKKIPRSDVDDL